MRKPKSPEERERIQHSMTAEERQQMLKILADQDRDYCNKIVMPKTETKTSKEINLYVPEKWERW